MVIPKPYYQDAHVTVYNGDCVAVMQSMPDNSVDAIVTDPPYHLHSGNMSVDWSSMPTKTGRTNKSGRGHKKLPKAGFMGKTWDGGDIAFQPAVWREALRILKPGGHLLAFGGTRTFHRMVCAIEDAGFEVRDTLMWCFGSGFPKSLDVSKAIDKAAGAEREVVGTQKRSQVASEGWDRPWKQEAMKEAGGTVAEFNITAPATEAARQWSGWGTALKPSLEPITMARKPLIGTVAANVLQYGTGGINVDGCRVGTDEAIPAHHGTNGADGHTMGKRNEYVPGSAGTVFSNKGRWPANLIHDGSDEVLALFPETDSGGGPAIGTPRTKVNTYSEPTVSESMPYGANSGSAARFFYTAKADSSERRQSKHPTVKPLDLIRYLVRMVTPEGGVVLDPFLGSGTLCEAARAEHCKSIGIELDAAYCSDAVERLRQGVLF